MKYLYGFEDGTLKQDDQGPTDVDRLGVQHGTLYVYRIQILDGNLLIQELTIPPGHGDTWVEVEQAEVAATHGEEWHE